MTVRVRPMAEADLSAAAVVSAAAFGIEFEEPDGRRLWTERLAYALRSDPAGCFVAERHDAVIGVAQAVKRERLWCLSLLAVDPGVQSRGAGRQLLKCALDYDEGTDCGLIVSSNDPRALRLYGLAGFTLRPTFEAAGKLDRVLLPRRHREIWDGSEADLDALAMHSRAIRGAAHTDELRFALGRGARLLRHGDRGFAVVQPGRGLWLLVARDEEAAKALIWAALTLAGDTEWPAVRWITGGQDWAVRAMLEVGLQLRADGALGVRGDPGPLQPFIPSPPFA